MSGFCARAANRTVDRRLVPDAADMKMLCTTRPHVINSGMDHDGRATVAALARTFRAFAFVNVAMLTRGEFCGVAPSCAMFRKLRCLVASRHHVSETAMFCGVAPSRCLSLIVDYGQPRRCRAGDAFEVLVLRV